MMQNTLLSQKILKKRSHTNEKKYSYRSSWYRQDNIFKRKNKVDKLISGGHCKPDEIGTLVLQ